MYSHWVPNKYQAGIYWGQIGVQLFFVLSGFLITQILLRSRQTKNPKRALSMFVLRRALRIFPLFYFVITIAFILDVSPVRETIGWHLSYLSNLYFYLRNDWHGPISHFWSLAVEEQFYLFWPFIIIFISGRYLPWAIATLVIIGLAARLTLPILLPEKTVLLVLPIHSFDSLGMGAAIAYWRWKDKTFINTGYCLPLSLLGYLMLIALRNNDFTAANHDFFERSFMLLTLVGLVQFLVTPRPESRTKNLAIMALEYLPITYVGKISYGIYLIHNFTPIFVIWLAGYSGLTSIMFGFTNLFTLSVVTLAFATASWYFLENPILQLKKYLPYDSNETQSRSV